MKSYVRNCMMIQRRPDDGPLFIEGDGCVTARLDGYAILPVEEYARLRAKAREQEPWFKVTQHPEGMSWELV